MIRDIDTMGEDVPIVSLSIHDMPSVSKRSRGGLNKNRPNSRYSDILFDQISPTIQKKVI